jgi:hypothetical protein
MISIISIISSISGIHSLLALTNGMKYDSQYFFQHAIPDIQQIICSSSRRKTLKGILVASCQCISAEFATFFKKDGIHKSATSAASTVSP